jgi:hypothetical protein
VGPLAGAVVVRPSRACQLVIETKHVGLRDVVVGGKEKKRRRAGARANGIDRAAVCDDERVG